MSQHLTMEIPHQLIKLSLTHACPPLYVLIDNSFWILKGLYRTSQGQTWILSRSRLLSTSG